MSAAWSAKNPEAWREYKRAYYARNVDKIRQKQREWREANKCRVNDERRAAMAQWWRENKDRLAANELLRQAKRRAKRSGIECSITLADIAIPERCPLLDIQLIRGDGKLHANSPTLDRKDNTRGYVSGNVWVISFKANAAKGTLTADELVQLGTRLKAALAEGART